jgi:hypothetical protein
VGSTFKRWGVGQLLVTSNDEVESEFSLGTATGTKMMKMLNKVRSESMGNEAVMFGGS